MMPIRRYHQSWLPAMFDDFFDNEWMKKTNATAPAINVMEGDKEYTVQIAAPGMTREDFNVHVDEEGNLVISMEKKEKEKCKHDKEKACNCRYLRREFSYTKFQQTLILPEDVDKEGICATMCDGVLNIELPRLAPEKKEKKTKVIEIK